MLEKSKGMLSNSSVRKCLKRINNVHFDQKQDMLWIENDLFKNFLKIKTRFSLDEIAKFKSSKDLNLNLSLKIDHNHDEHLQATTMSFSTVFIQKLLKD